MDEKNGGIALLQGCLCLPIKAVAGESGRHDGFCMYLGNAFVLVSVVGIHKDVECVYLYFGQLMECCIVMLPVKVGV